MSINDESEYSLLFPVDGNIGSYIVTKRQLRGQAPFFRVEVIKLTASILTATKHEQFLSVLALTHVEDACGWAHSVFTEVGHFLGGLKFPVAVEFDDVASRQDSLVLNRESNVSAVLKSDEVLEVNLFEAESGFIDLTLAIANLEDDLLGALSDVVSPEADGY